MKPFFISIPHSGEFVPSEATWLHGLPEPVLMCDVDRYVDRLYASVIQELGVKTIKTDCHRYVVDLNRLPEDVDGSSVEGASAASDTGRFASGLHWTKTTTGLPLMVKPMSWSLHQEFLKRYFEPFHAALHDTYEQWRHQGFKNIYHLDAHSMPSRGTKAHRDPGQFRADIVVSDQDGKSCSAEFKDMVMKAYSQTGLKVAYNWPYVGGRVTEMYGDPERGQHTIQVEINRSLYMNEETKALEPMKAQVLSEKLTSAVRSIYQNLKG